MALAEGDVRAIAVLRQRSYRSDDFREGRDAFAAKRARASGVVDPMMPRIFSIGHSTRSLDELLALLGAHASYRWRRADGPRVTAAPHFTRAHLEVALPAAGVAYRWLPDLGGQRQPGPAPSPNTAWRDAAFRPTRTTWRRRLRGGAAELEAWRVRHPPLHVRRGGQASVPSAAPGGCVARAGWEVWHIENATQAPAHELPPFACRGADGSVTYPGPPQLPL